MAVAFDAVGPSSSGTGSATSPLTWSHTCAAGATELLVGATIFNGSTNVITAVSYGGNAMTLVGFTQSGTGGAGGVALYRLANPPSGANTVSVTFTGGGNTNAGSMSFTGSNGLGAAVTNTANATSVSASVAGTTTGGMVAAAACFGGTALITFSGTNGVAVQWQHPGGSGSGADNGCAGTVASAGGTQTVGFSDTGTDFWGIVAVELLPAAVGPPPSATVPARPWRAGGTTRLRRQYAPKRRRLIPVPQPVSPAAGAATLAGAGTLGTAAVLAAGATLGAAGSIATAPQVKYITGLGGTGAGYFTDNTGQPRMWLGDEVWALLTNAGRWNSGNYQSTFDTYFAARAAQGFTVCYSDMFGSTFIGGAANGQNWAGQTPFTSNNPSSGLNNTYWQVIDYALNSALANGITLALSFGGHWDWDTSGNAMFGFTGTQYQAAGNAIGTRYASQPNIAWLIMDDYFGSFDSSLTSLLTGLRASGDTHPIAIENYPETSSRFDLSTNGSLSWGASNTQYNFGYSYGETYLNVEYMYAESSPLTCIYGDGYFYQGGSAYNGGNSENSASAFDHAMRQDAWWAVASGARGWNIGDEGEWQWPSTAATQVSTAWFQNNNAGAIRTFMESLAGWHTLAPATGSTLITAGRGTRATQPSSGGGGGQYEIAFTNAYVAASRTPDTGSGSSLAVLYFPTGAATITIDQTKLMSGYTAAWVDPVTCATTSATAGSTYNPSTPGTNSQGGTDWVLVLQAPAGVSGSATLAGAASLAAAVTQSAGATLGAAGSLTALAAERAGAALSAAASLGDIAVQGSGGTLGGAGSLATAATQAAPAMLGGGGTLATAAALVAPATLTGTASLTAPVTLATPATLSGTATLAGSSGGGASGGGTLGGAGSLGVLATLAAPAALTGAGSLASPGTTAAAATLAGAASLAGLAVQAAPATLNGTASLAALATLRVPASLNGTATLTAIAGNAQFGAAALAAAAALIAPWTTATPATLAAAASIATAARISVITALSGTASLATATTLSRSAVIIAAASLAAAGISKPPNIPATSTPAVTARATSGPGVDDPRDGTSGVTARVTSAPAVSNG